MKLWLVYRDHELTDVCTDEPTALEAAEEQKLWVENYHGPHYPVLWEFLGGIEPLPLSEEARKFGARQWEDDHELVARSIPYGERIYFEFRESRP